MNGFPNFTCLSQQATMVASLSNQALSRGCQKQQTRMLDSNFFMSFSKLAAFFLAAGLLSGAPAQAKQCGQASWYGPGFYGNRTASGEILRPGTMTTAHPNLPFGSYIRVTNQSNGKSVVVKVSDRGPYVASRNLDLSYAAFTKIAHPGQGLANVCYQRV